MGPSTPTIPRLAGKAPWALLGAPRPLLLRRGYKNLYGHVSSIIRHGIWILEHCTWYAIYNAVCVRYCVTLGGEAGGAFALPRTTGGFGSAMHANYQRNNNVFVIFPRLLLNHIDSADFQKKSM